MKKFVSTAIAGAAVLSLAIPAFAQSSSSSSTSSSSSVSSSVKSEKGNSMKNKEPKKTMDAACMQAAVEKRDTAIMAGLDAYTVSIKASLTIRKDALKASWALADKTQRNAANKAAWNAFQGTWKKASQSMKAARKAAWAAFKTDAKACGQSGAEASGESTDNQI